MERERLCEREVGGERGRVRGRLEGGEVREVYMLREGGNGERGDIEGGRYWGEGRY